MNHKSFYMIYRYKHQQHRIRLVSLHQISAWTTKKISNGEIVGEITKPYIFHCKTNKLEKYELFCKRTSVPEKLKFAFVEIIK